MIIGIHSNMLGIANIILYISIILIALSYIVLARETYEPDKIFLIMLIIFFNPICFHCHILGVSFVIPAAIFLPFIYITTTVIAYYGVHCYFF